MDVYAGVSRAYERIRSHVRETPLEYSRVLTAQTGVNVYLKLENIQHTGSFKFRGAIHKMLSLGPAHTVITASTGNHGAAVARACTATGAHCIVYVPANASPAKLNNMHLYNAEVRVHGVDSVESELYAIDYARHNQLPFISPYNDPAIIAGQGTCALEFSRQLEQIDAVFVATGGGGLIGGVAGYLNGAATHKRTNPPYIYACQPSASQVMYASVKAGHIVDIPSEPTLSDGTAGGIEPGAITLPLVRSFVDEFALVEEPDIASAMRLMAEKHHLLVEGAAALALAAFLNISNKWWGKNVVIIICGGNVSMRTVRSVLL